MFSLSRRRKIHVFFLGLGVRQVVEVVSAAVVVVVVVAMAIVRVVNVAVVAVVAVAAGTLRLFCSSCAAKKGEKKSRIFSLLAPLLLLLLFFFGCLTVVCCSIACAAVRSGRGGRGGRAGGKADPDDINNWVPVTKLGRLVKEKLVKRLEEVFLFSLPVKEPQIVDWFLGKKLVDDVVKIMPVQKQTKAGQRTRFKAYIVVGDKDGHVGLGAKCAKEVSGAIKGAIADAKVNLVPVRRGYWG
jgi:hypothetical protein